MSISRKKLKPGFVIHIQLLDDKRIEYIVSKESSPKNLLDYVFLENNIVEEKYFGLRFLDDNKQRHWVDIEISLEKQMKHCSQPYLMFFRVMLYPSVQFNSLHPTTLTQLLLQVKRDLRHGRILCSKEQRLNLLAFSIDVRENPNIILNDQDLSSIVESFTDVNNEEASWIIQKYYKIRNATNISTSVPLLERMRALGCYGLDPHPYFSEISVPFIGLNPSGVSFIEDYKIVRLIPWQNVTKLSRRGHDIKVSFVISEKKTSHTFHFLSISAGKHFKHCALLHLKFYSEKKNSSFLGRHYSLISPMRNGRISENTIQNKTTFGERNNASVGSVPFVRYRKSNLVSESSGSTNESPIWQESTSDDTIIDEVAGTNIVENNHENSNSFLYKTPIPNSLKDPASLTIEDKKSVKDFYNNNDRSYKIGILLFSIVILILVLLLALK